MSRKIRPVLTELAVFQPPQWMEDWRMYRIEYGFEGTGLPEGTVWLPPDVNPEDLEAWLTFHIIEHEQTPKATP